MIVTIDQLAINVITSYHDGDSRKDEDYSFNLLSTDGILIVVSLDGIELAQLKNKLDDM